MSDEKRKAMAFLTSFGKGDEDKKSKKDKKDKKEKKSKESPRKGDAQTPDDDGFALTAEQLQAAREEVNAIESMESIVTDSNPAPSIEHEEPKQVLLTQETSNGLPAIKSILYEEDAIEEGHIAVWGSLWEPTSENGRWGYACCRSFTRHQPCPFAPAEVAGATASRRVGDKRSCTDDVEKFQANLLRDKMDADDMEDKAKVARKKRRLQEFKDLFLLAEREDFRSAAAKIELSDYGSQVELPESLSGAGVPLRMFARREVVAWEWAGKLQPTLDGGGESADEW